MKALEEKLKLAVEEAEREGKLLLLTKFGSHLYGTATENSDTDIYGIFVPDPLSVYLGKNKKSIRFNSSGENAKNSKEDFDIVIRDFRDVIKNYFSAETNSIDLLSAITNKDALIYVHPVFEMMFEHFFVGRKAFPSNTAGIIGYVNQQASKYGIKGTRLGEVIELKEFLNELDKEKKLLEFEDKIKEFISQKTHLTISEVDYLEKGGKKSKISALDILGRKVPMYSPVRDAISVAEKVIEKYGERAKKAKDNEGVDFKALSHAMRIMYQFEDMVNNNRGYVQFPLMRADLLRRIKNGELYFEEVKNLLEEKYREILPKIREFEERQHKNISDEIIVWTLENLAKYVDGKWKKVFIF